MPTEKNKNILIVRSDVVGDTATVSIIGDVIGPDIVKVSRAIEAYKISFYNPIVVDLSLVHFIDSAGLGALIYSKKILEKNNKQIMFKTSKAVDTILESCNLHKVFTIAPAS